MLLVINHLTRMSAGYICVAGLDLANRSHVRPVLDGAQLSTELLRSQNGPFEMAGIVELTGTKATPSAPEVEDHKFDAANAKFQQFMPPETFWALLDGVAKNSLIDIFGPQLVKRGERFCGTDPGKGRASLGVLRPKNRPTLEVRTGFTGKKQIRMNLSDGQFNLDLSVTDIRLYDKDHITPNDTVIGQAQKRLANGEEILLSVGLTRPKALGNYPSTHWLQVNGIHFRTRAGWRLTK